MTAEHTHRYEHGADRGEEFCTVCHIARWMIEAEARCTVDGHVWAEGRCIHCRTYQPDWPPEDELATMSDDEFDLLIAEIEAGEIPEHCEHWTADQGCPLHGEACAAALAAAVER